MQRTLRTALRFLLPLTVLVAAPLLGLGDRARAGYIAPLSVAHLNPDSFSAGVSQAGRDEIGASSSTEESVCQEADRHSDIALTLPPLTAWPSAAALLGASSGGMGSPPSPNNPGTASSSQPPALASRPPADVPALVGVLFLETASRMPPPFPSRLFRPPR